MKFKVIASPPFLSQLKRLGKKYPSIIKDIDKLGEILESDPFQGSPLGKSSYKIRLKITSKGKGKSGGGRVITHIIIIRQAVIMVALYDKSEKETISETEIENLIKQLNL